MNLITYRFTLDLAKHGSQTVLSGFKVGDTNRAIDVSLSMNGEPYYLGADQAAQLRAKYIGENEVVKQTYACTIANNRIFCKIDPALLTATGELHLDLEVGDLDSEIFSTASFLIFVKGTVSNDEEIPSDDYTSVITALANSENALKNSISTAEVEENGNLVFTLHDGKMLDCGNVIGPQGPQGDKGDKGEKGDKGDKGDVDHTALAEVRRYKHDYDCNGVVDINDAVYLLYHTRNSDEYPIPSWCNADFNGDGVVNEEDAIDMQYAVNYPADYPHLYDTDARTADYSIVANALKGKVSGEAVSMKDVSPLEHNIGVKLASDTITDFSSVTLTKCGKNLFVSDGYSASGNKGDISNSSGTTLNTIEPINGITVTQSTYSNPSDAGSWRNGYLCILFKEQLKENQKYTISYDIEILDNPLNTNYLLMFFNGNYVFRSENNITPYEVGKKYRITGECTYQFYEDKKYLEIRSGGMSFVLSNIQIELGTATEYEPYKEPIPYTPNEYGTVDGVTSLYPSTTLLTDTDGVTITAEYNKDLNKAFEEIQQKLTALSAVLINNA